MEDIKTKHQVHVPKRVREYMIELLSMFVAVALAFLSQYFFQYRSDRSTEHDLMVSMVADLRTDIKNIDKLSTSTPEFEKSMISLRNLCLSEHSTFDLQKRMLQFSIVGFGRTYFVNFAQGTISQLKNAGGLRLIKDSNIIDAITEYDNTKQHLDTYAQNVGIRKQDFLQHLEKSFLLNSINIASFDHADLVKIFTKHKSLILNDSFDLLAEFSNSCFIFETASVGYSMQCEGLKKQAENLIELIQSRYHID